MANNKKLLESGFIDERCLIVNSTHNIEYKLKRSIYNGVFNTTLSQNYVSIVSQLKRMLQFILI